MFLFQILNPNPEAMSKIITENSSEEFLYSLSNYCALQVRLRIYHIISALFKCIDNLIIMKLVLFLVMMLRIKSNTYFHTVAAFSCGKIVDPTRE
jgi:hypothetical protein